MCFRLTQSNTLIHAHLLFCHLHFTNQAVAARRPPQLVIGISRHLQAPGMDIIEALSEISLVTSAFQSIRDDVDNSFSEVFKKTVGLANTMNVEVIKQRSVGRLRFRDNTGVEEYFKVNLFIPLLDGYIRHLQDRFGPTQAKTLSLGHLIPAHIGTYEQVKPSVQFFNAFVSEEEVEGEFTVETDRNSVSVSAPKTTI